MAYVLVLDNDAELVLYGVPIAFLGFVKLAGVLVSKEERFNQVFALTTYLLVVHDELMVGNSAEHEIELCDLLVIAIEKKAALKVLLRVVLRERQMRELLGLFHMTF